MLKHGWTCYLILWHCHGLARLLLLYHQPLAVMQESARPAAMYETE